MWSCVSPSVPVMPCRLLYLAVITGLVPVIHFGPTPILLEDDVPHVPTWMAGTRCPAMTKIWERDHGVPMLRHDFILLDRLPHFLFKIPEPHQEPDVPTQPVRLETERLVLDAHRREDFEALAEMWADPAVVRFISGRPSTPEESWMRLLRYGGLWPMLGYGSWAVREKATGRFVGDVGFADYHRSIELPIRGVPEAGWVLAPWAHGLGFGREATAAIFAWADTEPGFERIVCLIDPGNTASIRLAERNGFAESTAISFRDEPALLLTRRRPR